MELTYQTFDGAVFRSNRSRALVAFQTDNCRDCLLGSWSQSGRRWARSMRSRPLCWWARSTAKQRKAPGPNSSAIATRSASSSRCSWAKRRHRVHAAVERRQRARGRRPAPGCARGCPDLHILPRIPPPFQAPQSKNPAMYIAMTWQLSHLCRIRGKTQLHFSVSPVSPGFAHSSPHTPPSPAPQGLTDWIFRYVRQGRGQRRGGLSIIN